MDNTPPTAWDWLKQELERMLGTDQSSELWAEYWRRCSQDNARREVRQRKERWMRFRHAHDRQWLLDRGYDVDAGTKN